MVGDLLDADIVFPFCLHEFMAHVNRQVLVLIAFRCNDGVEFYCFDPSATVSFDWHCFMQGVFRWATSFGIRPISMIGCLLPRRGYDLEQDFQAWLFDSNIVEGVTALS